jgi:hypothetical protein
MCERGTTIVEIMVAVVVLGVGVLPVIALMGSGYRYQGQARLDVQMATMAESKIEELIAVARTDLPDTVALSPGGSLEADAAGHFDSVVHEGRTFARRWQVELGPAGTRDVTLRVTGQPSVGRAIEVSTQVIHD